MKFKDLQPGDKFIFPQLVMDKLGTTVYLKLERPVYMPDLKAHDASCYFTAVTTRTGTFMSIPDDCEVVKLWS